jgi:hypothetical protein
MTILIGDNRIGDRPIDAESGVIPPDNCRRLRAILALDEISYDRVVLERGKAMGAPHGYVDRFTTGCRQLHGGPSAKSRRLWPQVKNNVPSLAGDACDKLSLPVWRALKMKGAYCARLTII